jgi:hypothetical protein
MQSHGFTHASNPNNYDKNPRNVGPVAHHTSPTCNILILCIGKKSEATTKNNDAT